ncbi:MAG: hypothetical protein KatS3mg068_1710 [Candidatus Sericytochromatia bacterium]|nr:MAG: hypothetical protein KatS3mg068_1710 [Candidatus Sericytochromatia bacterium]
MLKSIIDIFKVKTSARTIIIIIGFLILFYEIISELFLNISSEINTEIIFVRDILFLVILCFGIIIYFLNLRFYIDYDKYWEKINKIKFAKGQLGTDALCCFLTKKDNAVNLPRKNDKLIICCALDNEFKEDKSLEEIIETNHIKIYTEAKSCINLKMKYKIENNFLILKFYCNDYENRPDACKEYPMSTNKPCRAVQYCSKPIEHIEFFRWAVIMFYAFDMNKYKELEDFSVGIARNIFKSYYLIPIPFYNSKYQDIICENK